MALIKYTRPRPETDLIFRPFESIIDEIFNGNRINPNSKIFTPSVDIAETDKNFEITVEIPGVKKEDIKINLEKNVLTVKGERSFENKEEGKNYHRVETSYGSFQRSLTLPEDINDDSIVAKYEDGLLKITVEKSEEKIRKEIEVL